jgi:hypothetical protein
MIVLSDLKKQSLIWYVYYCDVLHLRMFILDIDLIPCLSVPYCVGIHNDDLTSRSVILAVG